MAKKMQLRMNIGIAIFLILFIFISFASYIVLTFILAPTSSKLWYYFLITTCSAIFFAIILFFFLRKFVLKKLEQINSEFLHYKVTGELALKKINEKNYLEKITGKYRPLPIGIPGDTKKQDGQKLTFTLQNPSKEATALEGHYDDLTSVLNPIFFNKTLNMAITRSKRHKQILAIILIDLDQFKLINKRYSEEIGNLVLKELAKRFINALRAEDIIARSGGDEFIILLNDIIDPKHAGHVANKILDASKKTFEINDQRIHLQASVGISIFPNDGESLEDLQKHADEALFKARHLGGGIYQYFSKEMDIAAHEYIKMESALRTAIKNKELILYFQPQLSLENGSIKTVEALIRWNHPKLGILTPEKFIPLAEESGLILSIGEWALQEACRINKNWQNAGYDPITVAVNISPLQMYQGDLAQKIATILKEQNLAANYLEIEITETVIMENAEIIIDKLLKINQMGVKIAIDDFGIGYTSINYLRKFPVSILKIDQTYIKGIPFSTHDTAITSAVIALGHNLGLDVVAEGVETIEQIQYLAEHNCDLIQGYFLSRPLPAAKIILQLSRKNHTQQPKEPLPH